jgi:ABC-2 type transport system ATP-binding protein
MRILTCFMPPTSGSAKVGGYDIFEQSMDIRRITGYLPENPPLYHEMSVNDYLGFVARLKGVSKKNLTREVDTVVQKTSIGDVRQRLIGKLSKGYKQRVGLAQSLLNNPQIVILDEPTVGLDPKQIIEIRELIKNLAGEHTVILSSHILPEIEQTCERVVIINDGKVVAEDRVDDLARRMRGGERQILKIEGSREAVEKAVHSVSGTSAVQISAGPEQIWDVVVESESDLRRQLAKAVTAHELGLLELRSEQFTLEDVFLKLTMKEEN